MYWYISLYLSIAVSIYICVYLSIYLGVKYIFIYVYLSIYPYKFLYLHLSFAIIYQFINILYIYSSVQAHRVDFIYIQLLLLMQLIIVIEFITSIFYSKEISKVNKNLFRWLLLKVEWFVQNQWRKTSLQVSNFYLMHSNLDSNPRAVANVLFSPQLH